MRSNFFITEEMEERGGGGYYPGTRICRVLVVAVIAQEEGRKEGRMPETDTDK
jgi:hypothetical protein